MEEWSGSKADGILGDGKIARFYWSKDFDQFYFYLETTCTFCEKLKEIKFWFLGFDD